MSNQLAEIAIPERIIKAIELLIENGAQPSRITAKQLNNQLSPDQIQPVLGGIYLRAYRQQHSKKPRLRQLIEVAHRAALYLSSIEMDAADDLVDALLEALQPYEVNSRLGQSDEQPTE